MINFRLYYCNDERLNIKPNFCIFFNYCLKVFVWIALLTSSLWHISLSVSPRMPRFGINDSTHTNQGTIIINVKGNRPAQV